jgi:hypothetical protein
MNGATSTWDPVNLQIKGGINGATDMYTIFNFHSVMPYPRMIILFHRMYRGFVIFYVVHVTIFFIYTISSEDN